MAGESEANGKLSRRQSNFRVGNDPLMTKEEGSIPIGGRGVDPPWCLQSLIPLTSLTQAGLASYREPRFTGTTRTVSNIGRGFLLVFRQSSS
jgi:hypothetical protein